MSGTGLSPFISGNAKRIISIAMIPIAAIPAKTTFQPKASDTVLPIGTPIMSAAVNPIMTVARELACFPGERFLLRS